jgi:hypothetical protein
MADFNEETVRELNDSIRELTEVMQSAMGITGSSANTQKSFNKGMGDAASSASTLNVRNKEVATSSVNVSTANKAAAVAAYKVGESFNTLFEATKQSKDALLSFGKSMVDTTDSFSKYSAALNQASGALSTGLSAFGPIGKLLGTLLKPLTMVVDSLLSFEDRLFSAKDELSKFGAVGKYTKDEILGMGNASNFTSHNIERYAKIVSSAGVGLVGLGGTVNEGIKDFSKLSVITKQEQARLLSFGVSMEDYVQNTADFVKLQTMSGRMLTEEMKNSGFLQRASKEYTENLLVLSAISGEDVNAQKQKQMQLAMEHEAGIADLATTNKIRQLEKGTAEERNEAARLQRKMQLEVEARDLTAATLGMDAAKALQHYLKTGVMTPETVKIMRNSQMSLEEFRQAIASGKDVSAKFVTGLSEAQLNLVSTQTLALQLNKEYAQGMGINQEMVTKLAALQGRSVEEVVSNIKKDMAATKVKDAEDEKTRANRIQGEQEVRKNLDDMSSRIVKVLYPVFDDFINLMINLTGHLKNLDFKKLATDFTKFYKSFSNNAIEMFGTITSLAGSIDALLIPFKLYGKTLSKAGEIGSWIGGKAADVSDMFKPELKGFSKSSGQKGATQGTTAPSGTSNNISDLFRFAGGSGTKDNFEKLDPKLKNALIGAATEYNNATGDKLQINSAFRSEEQNRMVGGAKNSKHLQGKAVDIQQYRDPRVDAILADHGLTNRMNNQHYEMPGARLGGSFSGPNSGYPVMLHGAETVVPTPNPSTTLLKVEGDAAADKLTSAMAGVNSDALSSIMEELYSMMEYKLTEMVDKLSTSNDLQDKLLKVQM